MATSKKNARKATQAKVSVPDSVKRSKSPVERVKAKANAASKSPVQAKGKFKVIRVASGRPGSPSEADMACEKLLRRKQGATVSEIRKATGWKGQIWNGPRRAAERITGKPGKLDWEGRGEEARYFIVK